MGNDLAEAFVAKQEARQPTFSVFRRAHDGFAAVAKGDFSDPDYAAMAEFKTVLRASPGDPARWALIFISLWFCDNFAPALWEGLIRSDPSAAQCAVEHCYHVWAVSGADGSPQLAELLNRTSAWGLAQPKLAEVAGFSEQARHWVRRVEAGRL